MQSNAAGSLAPLRRTGACPHLLSPIELPGGVVLPNRVLMGSMHTGLEEAANGFERLAAFYAERARGGVALIVAGGLSPNVEGNMFERPRHRDQVGVASREPNTPQHVHALALEDRAPDPAGRLAGGF